MLKVSPVSINIMACEGTGLSISFSSIEIKASTLTADLKCLPRRLSSKNLKINEISVSKAIPLYTLNELQAEFIFKPHLQKLEFSLNSPLKQNPSLGFIAVGDLQKQEEQWLGPIKIEIDNIEGFLTPFVQRGFLSEQSASLLKAGSSFLKDKETNRLNFKFELKKDGIVLADIFKLS